MRPAATTRACGSAKRIGPQSAVPTPTAIPGSAVATASAFGPSPGPQTSRTVTISAEWIW